VFFLFFWAKETTTDTDVIGDGNHSRHQTEISNVLCTFSRKSVNIAMHNVSVLQNFRDNVYPLSSSRRENIVKRTTRY